MATNENLVKYWEDLYHRFNEFSIHIPSLKKRGKDILILAAKFLAVANQELNKDSRGFSEGMQTYLLNYS